MKTYFEFANLLFSIVNANISLYSIVIVNIFNIIIHLNYHQILVRLVHLQFIFGSNNISLLLLVKQHFGVVSWCLLLEILTKKKKKGQKYKLDKNINIQLIDLTYDMEHQRFQFHYQQFLHERHQQQHYFGPSTTITPTTLTPATLTAIKMKQKPRSKSYDRLSSDKRKFKSQLTVDVNNYYDYNDINYSDEINCVCNDHNGHDYHDLDDHDDDDAGFCSYRFKVKSILFIISAFYLCLY